MGKQSEAQFDFEDWAGLYLENPQEFEARRKAALMIQMTRGTAEQCANGRVLLESFEARAEGCDSKQRMQLAASMMAESARQLSTELMVLKSALHGMEDQDEE